MTAKPRPMTPGIPTSARLRAYVVGGLLSLALIGVLARAWGLQVEQAEHFREVARQQHASTVNIPAPRGDVVDVRGRPLAVSADADSIWANPHDITDVTETADKLAKLVHAEPAALEAKLAGDRKFVWIDRHVPSDVAAAVRKAALPGILVAKEPRRWYPGRSLGGPVIGRADIDSRGLEGIELSMNGVLEGARGAGLALRDARGRRMFADGLAQPEPGATVRLTLDRTIQSISDRALAEAITANEAKSGVVVVLDVATGQVLAMSSYPSFDPNASEGHHRNKPITDAFEAGSVMKVFTVAAALDEGIVTPDTGFDTNPFTVGPKTIRDVHHDPYLTVAGIIKRSSNIGTVKIALRLGRERLHAALKKFGFGGKTQIELPGEVSGWMREGATWREIELATIAFGYGITVTPLQIAAALAAIGNDGVYRAPRIVDRMIDPDGTLLYEGTAEPRRMLSSRTAEQMRRMLATVFEGGKDGGTAASIVVPGFRCGGKTGTAHKYDAETRQYSPNRYLSSFAGLAPIDQPRLAIVVMVDEPSGGDYYGGKVAGPVFATVASETLRYLGVPGLPLQCPTPLAGLPTHLDPTPKTCTIPAPRKPRAESAAPTAEPATISDVDEPVALPAGSVPDFQDLGLSKALDVARDAGIAVEIEGSGRVIAQVPIAGAPRPADARVTLRFSELRDDRLASVSDGNRPGR